MVAFVFSTKFSCANIRVEAKSLRSVVFANQAYIRTLPVSIQWCLFNLENTVGVNVSILFLEGNGGSASYLNKNHWVPLLRIVGPNVYTPRCSFLL